MSLPAWEDSDEPVSERPATKMLNHSHISGISLNNTGIPSRSGIDTFESLSNGNRVHRAPLATASTPMHNMAPQASLSRGNGENMTNNISGVLHQKPIYTAKQEQQEFDELSCRQWMSNISDRIDILRRGISDIHNHIMNTSDIDKKAINTIFPVTEHQSYNQVKLNNINRGNRNNYGGVIDMAQTLYAQETNAVESSIIDLQACLSDVLFCFSDCFDSRKTSYVAQLKKMRDVANNATRNAIQTCKMDTTNSLNQLKHSLERKKEMEFTDINKRLRESESSNGKIVLQMGEIKMQLEQAQANEREYLYKMQQLTDAHQKSSEEKLKEHVSNLNNEALKYEEKLAKEKQRMKAEYAEQLKTLSDQHNVSYSHCLCFYRVCVTES